MQISVVIPTHNRKTRLISLLQNLSASTFPLHEIIVVDSSNEAMEFSSYPSLRHLNIVYLRSEPSVCIQRNTGIKAATAAWVFICDDDIEVPADYLQKITEHMLAHPEAGAVSGIVLQKEKGTWTATYPLTSSKQLVLSYIFQLSIWGEIKCTGNNFILQKIKSYYWKKGNHLSKAGWPVITDFSGAWWTTPVYGLGASVIKKDWLMAAPYDEVLDRHGIGDNYGVAIQFPVGGVHVLNNAFVYHHHEQANRLQKALQYYRRALALDYFIRTIANLKPIKKRWLLWSLMGNLVIFIFSGNRSMIYPAFKSFWQILWGRNPYLEAARKNGKRTEPLLYTQQGVNS